MASPRLARPRSGAHERIPHEREWVGRGPRVSMRRLFLLAAMLLPSAALPAQPVIADKSSISAVARRPGGNIEAVFHAFSAQIDFDPARPGAGRARIDVDVASLDAGDPGINEEARGRQWFDVRTHPRASFVSTAVRARGPGRFEARGVLTIKGRMQEVVAPFSVKDVGAVTLYEGQLPVRRLDYGLGDGTWRDTKVLADEIVLRFRIAAARPLAATAQKPPSPPTGERP